MNFICAILPIFLGWFFKILLIFPCFPWLFNFIIFALPFIFFIVYQKMIFFAMTNFEVIALNIRKIGFFTTKYLYFLLSSRKLQFQILLISFPLFLHEFLLFPQNLFFLLLADVQAIQTNRRKSRSFTFSNFNKSKIMMATVILTIMTTIFFLLFVNFIYL